MHSRAAASSTASGVVTSRTRARASTRLAVIRAARAVTALEGGTEATVGHLRHVALMALPHRLRRDPLEEGGSSVRIERAMADVLGA